MLLAVLLTQRAYCTNTICYLKIDGRPRLSRDAFLVQFLDQYLKQHGVRTFSRVDQDTGK